MHRPRHGHGHDHRAHVNGYDCGRLLGHARALADPPSVRRNPGSPGHAAAIAYLEAVLRSEGIAPFDGVSYRYAYVAQRDGAALTNLAARVRGGRAAEPLLLLGAHFDHLSSSPGADDNAAAVAIVLEVARELRAQPPAHDVAIVLYDAEEPHYFRTADMGSLRFYREVLAARAERVALPVVLDLCGHDVEDEALADSIMLMGLERSRTLRALFDRRLESGLPLHPIPVPNGVTGDVSDYHAFRVAGYPFAFLTCGRWSHYHRASDTVSRLRPSKMAAVAAYVERLLRAADAALVGRPGCLEVDGDLTDSWPWFAARLKPLLAVDSTSVEELLASYRPLMRRIDPGGWGNNYTLADVLRA
ncbi:M28 family peptidase [bacterium]|nr:MAG: M28 family peptidase [bacterium]